MASVVTGINPVDVELNILSNSTSDLQSEVNTINTNAQALALVVGSKASSTDLAVTQANLAGLTAVVGTKATQSDLRPSALPWVQLPPPSA